MEKSNYDNPIRRQVFSLPDLVDAQLDSCFSGEKLNKLMSMAEIFDARYIIATGAGDSYTACAAALPALEKYCDVMGIKSVDIMEFTRFMLLDDLGIGEPNSPFLIAVSAGGGTARVVEALEKSAKAGAFPILVTNNPDSASAIKAHEIGGRVFQIDTPQMGNDFPGLRSYFASLVGLFAIACRMGHVRGILPPTAPMEFQAAIKDYVLRFGKEMERIDDQMFELAKKWHRFERFDFIGDGQGLSSAHFALEKFVECTGAYCGYDDSEDWCHINFFLKNPSSIGTIVFADKNQPSLSRIKETIWSACEIGRSTLVITNCTPDDFHVDCEVCQIPEAMQGYKWLTPLMDIVPTSILAGYIAALGGQRFFQSFDLKENTWDKSAPLFEEGVSTMKNSKIEIYL